MSLALPFILEGDSDTDGRAADILLYPGIKWIVRCGGMKIDKARDLAGEPLHAVEGNPGQRPAPGVELPHPGIAQVIVPAAGEGGEKEQRRAQQSPADMGTNHAQQGQRLG